MKQSSVPSGREQADQRLPNATMWALRVSLFPTIPEQQVSVHTVSITLLTCEGQIDG